MLYFFFTSLQTILWQPLWCLWSSGQPLDGPCHAMPVSTHSDSGTESNCHPGHTAINHPAGTGLHFLYNNQFLLRTKRPLWALGHRNLCPLLGSWALWALLQRRWRKERVSIKTSDSLNTQNEAMTMLFLMHKYLLNKWPNQIWQYLPVCVSTGTSEWEYFIKSKVLNFEAGASRTAETATFLASLTKGGLLPSLLFLTFLFSTPSFMFGCLHLRVRVWGTTVFLAGQIKTGDCPQGAQRYEASDTSRKSEASHLQRWAQQWEHQWGVRTNIPQTVLTHKTLGFAWRITLLCLFFFFFVICPRQQKFVFPHSNRFPNPNLLFVKAFSVEHCSFC